MFGPHLILEAYGCPTELLADVSLISKILDDYPEQLKMTKIMPPYVFKYQGTVPEDWGVSGVVMIAESHISIHTFAEKGFVVLDIFSCKAFDVDAAIEKFCAAFKPESYHKRLLKRGYHFPKNMEKVSRIIDTDRTRFGQAKSPAKAKVKAVAAAAR